MCTEAMTNRRIPHGVAKAPAVRVRLAGTAGVALLAMAIAIQRVIVSIAVSHGIFRSGPTPF
jgi:hypothetical protein